MMWCTIVLCLCSIFAKTLCDRSKLITPYYSMRSQSSSAARELIGWAQFINRYTSNDSYAVFACTPEYSSSFRPNHLTECFFGRDYFCRCDEGLTITGSRVADRNDQLDWLADYFGLPTDFQSRVTFSPSVDNIIV